MVFFKTYVAIGVEVNYPQTVSQVLCHLEIKFQMLSHVFEGKLFHGHHANIHEWFPRHEIQDGARKPEVVSFWHMWLYVNESIIMFSGRQIKCHHYHSDQNLSRCHISRWRRKSTTTILNRTLSTCERRKRFVQNWKYLLWVCGRLERMDLQ